MIYGTIGVKQKGTTMKSSHNVNMGCDARTHAHAQDSL